MISDTFNYLPIAAVVGNRIFCVHGGISPLIKNLAALNTIKRPVDYMENKIVSDMMWADPNKSI
jgi:serine/threonine-protein phosphatase PP1 catalytic subunit